MKTRLTAAALACALFLTACSANSNDASTDNTRNRQAASSDLWSNTDPCKEQSSWTFDMKITNLTSIPLTLLAGEVDCYDWSGMSVPRRVLNGQDVAAGRTNGYRLEPSTSSDRNWTMGLKAQGSQLGTFRASIPRGTSEIKVAGTTETAFGNCQKTRVGTDPTSSASTTTPTPASDTLWLYSDGASIFAITCPASPGYEGRDVS